MYAPPNPTACHFAKRIMAMVYDLLLLFAILMLATLLFNALLVNIGVMAPPTVDTLPSPAAGSNELYAQQAFLLLLAWAFYVVFWSIGGQTLALRTWKMRVVASDGSKASMAQLTLRWLLVPLTLLPAGLGLLWALGNPDRQTLYDLWSGTKLVRETPKF